VEALEELVSDVQFGHSVRLVFMRNATLH
jgi:hypothetical protein